MDQSIQILDIGVARPTYGEHAPGEIFHDCASTKQSGLIRQHSEDVKAGREVMIGSHVKSQD
jgi:hypothetical protein